MSGKLEGKVAVVTGGNSGIGLATAKRFVAEGAYVFITGRRQEQLDAAVKEIGHNVTGVQGDVAKLASEILTNPEGGYGWLFEQGDQKGKGHLDRSFKRPGVDIERQQVSDRVLILGSIQAPQRFGAARIRFCGRRRIERCFEPGQHCEAISGLDACRHGWGPQLRS